MPPACLPRLIGASSRQRKPAPTSRLLGRPIALQCVLPATRAKLKSTTALTLQRLKELLFGSAQIQQTDDDGNGVVDDDGNPVMIDNPDLATPWPDPVG